MDEFLSHINWWKAGALALLFGVAIPLGRSAIKFASTLSRSRQARQDSAAFAIGCAQLALIVVVAFICFFILLPQPSMRPFLAGALFVAFVIYLIVSTLRPRS